MSKSRSIGGIYASLSLRDEKFKAGLRSSRAALNQFGKASAKIGGAALATAATSAGAALAAGTLKTLDHVDALGDLSAQTGVAIADLMRLQQAYTDGGRSAEQVGADIGRMQKAIYTANSGGANPFESMGLSAAELFSKDPAGQFRAIGDAILKIQNPAERTAKSMEIFGKGGMGLATVFPGIDGAAKSVGNMAEMAQRFSGSMGEANDLIGHLPLKSDQFFVGFSAGVVGTILPELEKIDSYDFTRLGENLGDSLASGFEMFGEGDWFTVLEMKMAKGFYDIFGKITAVAMGSFDMIGAAAEARGRTILTRVFSGADAGDAAYDRIMAEKLSGFEDWANPFQSQIDDIDILTKNEWRKAKNRAQLKKDSAEALTGPMPVMPKPSAQIQPSLGEQFLAEVKNFKLPNSVAEEWRPFRPDAPGGAPAAEIFKSAAPVANIRNEVNDYQRRGLSLGGGSATPAEDKQIQLLQKIEKHLANKKGDLRL